MSKFELDFKCDLTGFVILGSDVVNVANHRLGQQRYLADDNLSHLVLNGIPFLKYLSTVWFLAWFKQK